MSATPDAFNAWLIERDEGGYRCAPRTLSAADLPEGDVLVRVRYSSLNYKDGLAVTGKGKIARRFPLVPGIDLAGEVVESAASDFKPGDQVLITGCEIGELHWGGYSQYQRVRAQWLVPIPAPFDARLAMGIGTAGFTAALAVLALEDHGIGPDLGPMVVTGAAGGVGSIAVVLLARAGYRVVASTGRAGERGPFLRELGAAEVIEREVLAAPCRPLESETYGGGVDTVGGQTLASLIARTRHGGAVAACGLAGGHELHTTVFPFILRGVSLLGINSVILPPERRRRAWDRLAADLPVEVLERLIRVEPMSRLRELAEDIVAGRIAGRVVIDVDA
ncbi:MDR family oxidoreductase [Inmirania thermothiophila]|uniref:Acrylyl-CoA reductase (NADPH) n=1 Tax=Inmirania thermothiophila TaxID=1750597 RepID=A0A3N1Y7B3_9GAMM|nr:MDR family oxidoreductase [Inmirania thermothiophila]ROR34418.1 acrylyl-CoA reductase (NADPH) [Inmirania thermothiophila]